MPRPNPIEFTDVNTGERNSLLTPGGMAQVVGHRLKFDPADLMFIVPAGLPSGDYTLEVRAVAHGSDEVRSGALDAVLTVA